MAYEVKIDSSSSFKFLIWCPQDGKLKIAAKHCLACDRLKAYSFGLPHGVTVGCVNEETGERYTIKSVHADTII